MEYFTVVLHARNNAGLLIIAENATSVVLQLQSEKLACLHSFTLPTNERNFINFGEGEV